MKAELVEGPHDGEVRDGATGHGLDDLSPVLHLRVVGAREVWYARYVRDGWTAPVTIDRDDPPIMARLLRERRPRYRFCGYSRDRSGQVERPASRRAP